MTFVRTIPAIATIDASTIPDGVPYTMETDDVSEEQAKLFFNKTIIINNVKKRFVFLVGREKEIPSVGDTIRFGNYPQETSEPESIEWTVLDVDTTNRRALLISKKVLDCQKYNSTQTSVTWETCSLRTWLNNTFKETAFSNAEKNLIYKSHIETDGNTTEDYVFCLSIQEASNTAYFADDASRKALATQRAIDDGAFTDSGYAYWWLRSQLYDNTFAALVLEDGDVYGRGFVVADTEVGVRPALWFKY